MPLFSRNVDLGPALKLSAWRKTAIGTWRSCGDPSVYGTLELDVAPAIAYLEKLKQSTGLRLTLTHFMGKAVADTIGKHPDINCILRFGRIYPRKTVDVFFQVAADTAGKELTGMTIREANKKSLADIAEETKKRVEQIRAHGDPAFRKSKQMMGRFPGWIVGRVLDFLGFVLYTLNVWSPLIGSPKDPFGSVMVTSIGTLGLDEAFAPLVPYSRVPILVAFGAARETPVVRDGKVVITQVAKACVTFDHRVIDGMHAAHMCKTIKKIFADPDGEFSAGDAI